MPACAQPARTNANATKALPMPPMLCRTRAERAFSARQVRERLVEEAGDVGAIARVGPGLHPARPDHGPGRAVDDVDFEDRLIALEEAALIERELLHLGERRQRSRRERRLLVRFLVG